VLAKPLAVSIAARGESDGGMALGMGRREGIRRRAQGHWYLSCAHYKAELSCQEFLNGA